MIATCIATHLASGKEMLHTSNHSFLSLVLTPHHFHYLQPCTLPSCHSLVCPHVSHSVVPVHMFYEDTCLTRNMNKHRFPTILTISSGHLSSCADVCLHRKMLHSPNLPPSYCLPGFPIWVCRCPSSAPSSQSSGGSYLGYVTFLVFLGVQLTVSHCVTRCLWSHHVLPVPLPSSFGNPILLSMRSHHIFRLVKFIGSTAIPSALLFVHHIVLLQRNTVVCKYWNSWIFHHPRRSLPHLATISAESWQLDLFQRDTANLDVLLL